MNETQEPNKGEENPTVNTQPVRVRVKKEFLPRVVPHAAQFDENGNLIN